MAGASFIPAGGNKIKGGRWTVFRFFLVSVAFASAWVAISSQLGYYRHLYGPAVLLQLNIAYFLPSIPLLIVSAFLDKPLEARLGVAKTILVRLLLGLVGYGAVCIWFPFMPDNIWHLLGAVVALGLFSCIAFSASYQLVARFANKNVIALGLGCSASGPVVLLLQLALDIGPHPTRTQQILLYETIAVVIVAGLWATVSLLLRHWQAIEAYASKQELAEPLLGWQQQQQQEQQPGGPSTAEGSPRAATAAAAEEGSLKTGSASLPVRRTSRSPRPPPLSPIPSSGLISAVSGGGGGSLHGGAPASGAGGQLQLLAASVWRQRSLPPLVAYPSLEPHQTFLSTDDEVIDNLTSPWYTDTTPAASDSAAGDFESGWGAGWPRQRSEPLMRMSPVRPETAESAADGGSSMEGDGSPPPGLKLKLGRPDTAATDAEAAATPQSPTQTADGGSRGGGSLTWQALRLMWPPLAAISLSSTIAITLFPLFTYVPTSGLLGESLPKVIFFVRIFADILGRFLPRLHSLATESPLVPLGIAGVKLSGVPLFLLYLKSSDRLHNDVAVVLFVTLLWLLGGYINTMGNMLAPKLVPPHLKGTAAGLMAIGYQVAHFLGLAIAALIALLMFGSIGVEG